MPLSNGSVGNGALGGAAGGCNLVAGEGDKGRKSLVPTGRSAGSTNSAQVWHPKLSKDPGGRRSTARARRSGRRHARTRTAACEPPPPPSVVAPPPVCTPLSGWRSEHLPGSGALCRRRRGHGGPRGAAAVSGLEFDQRADQPGSRCCKGPKRTLRAPSQQLGCRHAPAQHTCGLLLQCRRRPRGAGSARYPDCLCPAMLQGGTARAAQYAAGPAPHTRLLLTAAAHTPLRAALDASWTTARSRRESARPCAAASCAAAAFPLRRSPAPLRSDLGLHPANSSEAPAPLAAPAQGPDRPLAPAP